MGIFTTFSGIVKIFHCQNFLITKMHVIVNQICDRLKFIAFISLLVKEHKMFLIKSIFILFYSGYLLIKILFLIYSNPLKNFLLKMC